MDPHPAVGPLIPEDLSQLEDSSHALYYLLHHEKGYCAYSVSLDSQKASLSVRGRVTYTPRYTYQNIWEYLACHREEKQELYAYYDPEPDKIFLMPRTLGMILRGEYPAAAGVLHHENTHRIHFQNGLVSPSQTMLYYSVESFLTRMAQNSTLESLLVFLGGDLIRTLLHCNVSPMIFEEEAAAFSQDILYTYRHPEIEAIFPYRQESQEFLDYSLQSLRHYFLPQIFFLSQQYLEASYHLNP